MLAGLSLLGWTLGTSKQDVMYEMERDKMGQREHREAWYSSGGKSEMSTRAFIIRSSERTITLPKAYFMKIKEATQCEKKM